MKTIPFFTPDIAIRVNESSDRNLLGQHMTLGQFHDLTGEPLRLSENEYDGELLCQAQFSGQFIQGPEVK